MTGSSFPEFITSRRRALDLTLGDVASRLGVSPITVSNWSNGDSRPKPENLVALAGLLEVPAEELAEMAGISLGTPDVGVNLMPASDKAPEPEEPFTDEVDIDEPVAAVRMSEPVPPADEPAVGEPGPKEEESDLGAGEVPIPIEEDAVPVSAAAAADMKQSVGDAPDPVPATAKPDSVPAFVASAPGGRTARPPHPPPVDPAPGSEARRRRSAGHGAPAHLHRRSPAADALPHPLGTHRCRACRHVPRPVVGQPRTAERPQRSEASRHAGRYRRRLGLDRRDLPLSTIGDGA